jgi:hypothetical protein
MTCEECQDLMLEVARDRADHSIERAVLGHTASCAVCGSDLDRERALTAGLRGVARLEADSVPSPALEARLLAAFAALHQAAAAEVPGATSAQASGVRMHWLPLVAAVILSVAASTWWFTRSESVPGLPEVVRVERPAPARPIEPVQATNSHPTASLPAEQPHRHRRAAAKRPVQAVGFVPIPSAAGLPEFESGQIVRLGIPVAALPNYGLEMPSGSELSVQADLLVGQDGQPRAIRLVTASTPEAHPR